MSIVIEVGKDVVVESGKLGDATFSNDKVYRYRLTRSLGSAGFRICWAMLNPSKADGDRNDLTVSKCMEFSRRMGASSLVVVNLFALISTDPKKLLTHADPVGPLNRYFLKTAALGCDKLMVAWGALPRRIMGAAAPMVEELLFWNKQTFCLGDTKSGAPRHPSRLGYATNVEPWLN